MRLASLMIVAALAATWVTPASAAAQAPTLPALTIQRPDGSTLEVADSTMKRLARVSGRASAHGNEFTYEGIDVRELLRAAGVTPVDSLRGPMLRRVVTFVASDGYRAVIALSDLDPSIGARRAILVDREDGKPLGEGYAPRRLVIEGDKRPTRWVRMIVRVEVTDLK